MTTLDSKDLRLLALLQENGQANAASLADELHLSTSQIGRRRQRLETEGYIRRMTCQVDAAKVGLAVQAFIQIQTTTHTGETQTAFRDLARRTPEVIAAWTLTGEADYMLQVYCQDLGALNDLIQNVLLPHPSIGRVQSQIVMQELLQKRGLPIVGGNGR